MRILAIIVIVPREDSARPEPAEDILRRLAPQRVLVSEPDAAPDGAPFAQGPAGRGVRPEERDVCEENHRLFWRFCVRIGSSFSAISG